MWLKSVQIQNCYLYNTVLWYQCNNEQDYVITSDLTTIPQLFNIQEDTVEDPLKKFTVLGYNIFKIPFNCISICALMVKKTMENGIGQLQILTNRVHYNRTLFMSQAN